jgi:hypothetical protein
VRLVGLLGFEPGSVAMNVSASRVRVEAATVRFEGSAESDEDTQTALRNIDARLAAIETTLSRLGGEQPR